MPAETPIDLLREKLEDFQREAAITADPEKKFQLKKLIQQTKAELEEACAEAGADRSPAPKVSIERLPLTGEHFFGREEELTRLNAAWEDPHTHVLSIVAWGGAGKSALVNRWLARLAGEDWYGAERVFGWTFYSQGTKEQQATSADPFIDAALRWLGETEPPSTPWERGRRLAELVRQRRTLLVLDGLEPMQHPPGPLEGRLKDPALQALIRGLGAENRGLCVITTRQAVADVAQLKESTAPRLRLERLGMVAGVALLERLGVQGSAQELEAAVERFDGHALALSLLGSYLHTAYGGDVRRIDEVPVGAAGEHAGGHAFRVMEAYARWFGSESAEVAVLRLLGLFDRPVPGAAIAALRAAPVIPGLTEALAGLPGPAWNIALNHCSRLPTRRMPRASMPTLWCGRTSGCGWRRRMPKPGGRGMQGSTSTTRVRRRTCPTTWRA